MDFRLGKVTADCVDAITMASTRVVLLLLCGPFEICASIARSARSAMRMISRRRAERGETLGPMSRCGR
jgi:hypothetical protein